MTEPTIEENGYTVDRDQDVTVKMGLLSDLLDTIGRSTEFREANSLTVTDCFVSLAAIVCGVETGGIVKRKFPMLNGPSIDWKTAEKIYEIYSALYGTQQNLKKIAFRGGFGWDEVELMCRNYDSKFGTRALTELLGL